LLVAVGYVLAALPTTFSTPGVTVVLARGGCKCTVIRIWVVAEDFKGRPAAALLDRCKTRKEVWDRFEPGIESNFNGR
jgi:hypothetical protein